MRTIAIIAAVGNNNELGANNGLLWHLPDDLRRFKALTMHKPVIMGSKTFTAIGKPLPERLNIIITHDKNFLQQPDCKIADSFSAALQLAASYNLLSKQDEIMVIGGANVYRQALDYTTKLYLTCVHAVFAAADVFFPTIDWHDWQLSSEEYHARDARHQYDFTFKVYTRIQAGHNILGMTS